MSRKKGGLVTPATPLALSLLALIQKFYEVYRREMDIMPGESRQAGGDEMGAFGQFVWGGLVYDPDGTGSWRELSVDGEPNSVKILRVAECLLYQIKDKHCKHCGWVKHLSKGFAHKLQIQIDLLKQAIQPAQIKLLRPAKPVPHKAIV